MGQYHSSILLTNSATRTLECMSVYTNIRAKRYASPAFIVPWLWPGAWLSAPQQSSLGRTARRPRNLDAYICVALQLIASVRKASLW
eukprot:scaffold5391_cov26-Prasinocladus_malaysianus.AAC.1